MVMSVMPELTNSRTVCSMTGLSPTGSISLGMALVSGSSRDPMPAAGMTALLMVGGMPLIPAQMGAQGVRDRANPLISRTVAARTSGMACGNIMSPPWQVPATTRPTALTPAASSRR